MKRVARDRISRPNAAPEMPRLRTLRIALRFLTVLPVPSPGRTTPQEQGRSLVQFPVVGLLLGALLAGLALVTQGAPVVVAAAVVLLAWVGLTGALHLDGLADSADAWLGGLGDRERTLAIMRDPHCGPLAVVALVLVLLAKFAALSSLLGEGQWVVLLAVPLLARTALVWLFLTTPYVRPRGIGAELAAHLPRRACLAAAVAGTLAAALVLGRAALWVLPACAAALWLLRRAMLRRLDGTTGDTAGALVEVVETVALLAAAWSLQAPA
jgi:adenosylcobinamide-GDP ribazoletransferase